MLALGKFPRARRTAGLATAQAAQSAIGQIGNLSTARLTKQ